MNSAVLLKISLMLGILITLLLTPAFAQWVYYEFDTAPSVQKQYPIQMEEFNYEPQTVTLPGDSEVTTPPEDGGEGGDEGGEDLEDHNHSNMVDIIVRVPIKNDKVSINQQGSIINNAIIGQHLSIVYSEDNTLGKGNLDKEIENASAGELEFIITADHSQSPPVIIVYTYHALNGDSHLNPETIDRLEVYQIYLKYDANTKYWERDNSRIYIGTAKLHQVNGIGWAPDLSTFEYKT